MNSEEDYLSEGSTRVTSDSRHVKNSTKRIMSVNK